MARNYLFIIYYIPCIILLFKIFSFAGIICLRLLWPVRRLPATVRKSVLNSMGRRMNSNDCPENISKCARPLLYLPMNNIVEKKKMNHPAAAAAAVVR